MTTTQTGTLPNYAVPTGEFITEWMEDNGLHAAELARRLDVSRKHVSELLRGRVALTPDVALRLERVTGVPARTWSNLEALYQEDRARLAAEAELEAGYPAVAAFPVDYLRRWGFVTAPTGKPARPAVVAQVLAFFGVGDVNALTVSWAESAIAYRKTAASLPRREDLMTWLMVAEHLTNPADLPPFDHEKLQGMLPSLRALTRGNPQTYVQETADLLATAGVALCLVPEVPGLGVHGATRWLRDHPVIQLSVRGKTDDQLWFTLFHELAHVLLHPPAKLYVAGTAEKEEAEADRFAADTLIPPADAARLPLGRNLQAVRDFADQVGIAPGVALGRIHRETGDYGWGHDLKQHFVFRLPETRRVDAGSMEAPRSSPARR